MAVFASETLEGWKLPIPSEAGPGAFAPYLEVAWESGGLGQQFGKVIDSLGAAVPFEAIESAMGSIPTDAIPGASGIFKLAIQAFSWDRQRAIWEGRATVARGAFDMVYGRENRFNRPARTLPWRYQRGVGRWTDCRDLGNARRRPCFPPQAQRAPWREPGGFKASTGNCGQGYAVWCGDGLGDRKKPGADGSRCTGYADVSILLYPWWTAALPPGPAPEFRRTSKIDDLFGARGGPPPVPMNAWLAEDQAAFMASIANNFAVNLAEVVAMRNRLASLRGKGERMNVVPDSASYGLSDKTLNGAIGALDAFVSARAAMVRSQAGKDYVRSVEKMPKLFRPKLDKSAILEIRAPGKTIPTVPGLTVQPPKREPAETGSSKPGGAARVVLPFMALALALDLARGK